MTRRHVDGPMLLRAVAAATANLERHVHEVDALNVFPVPDGDTGSNMLATMRAALAEAQLLPRGQRDLDHVAEALSRGALIGARGNSGVILAHIIRGMIEPAGGRRQADGVDLARGLRTGAEAAYSSVLKPVEGTMLTVMREAAEAAETAADQQPHVESVLTEAIDAAATSVARTPMLLHVLEEAGVVDSGGQGLYRVLEGMLHVGQRDGIPATAPRILPSVPSEARAGGDRHTDGHGPHLAAADLLGYETQYLLVSAAGDIDIPALRADILAVGHSVVVAGDGRQARVHVHGERPDLAIAAGLAHGRLSHVEIHDLDDQVATRHAAPPAHPTEPAAIPAMAATSIAIVAIASAPGLADVLASLGAVVVRPARGTRPSVGEIVETIRATGASEAIVLPNDGDAAPAVRAAAALVADTRVSVISTRNAVEGIAASLAFDPARAADENVSRMEAEASSVRSFTVTTAPRDVAFDGRRVRAGAIVALDADGRLLAMGGDVVEVTVTAVGGFDAFELVAFYLGAAADADLEAALRTRFHAAGVTAELEFVAGGQAHAHLLVAVE